MSNIFPLFSPDMLIKELDSMNWEQQASDLITIADWIDYNGGALCEFYLIQFMFEPTDSKINLARERLGQFWNKIYGFVRDYPVLTDIQHPMGILQKAINYMDLVEPLDEAAFKKNSNESYWARGCLNRSACYNIIDGLKNKSRDKLSPETKIETIDKLFGNKSPDRTLFFREMEKFCNRSTSGFDLKQDSIFAKYSRFKEDLQQ